MADEGVDFRDLFCATPGACVVLDRSFRVVALNHAYTNTTGREWDELVGRDFFEAYRPDPDHPEDRGAEVHRLSLTTVLVTGRPDVLLLHRFAIPARDGAARMDARWWNVVNQPVCDPDGRVRHIIHRVEDVTEFVLAEERHEADHGSHAHVHGDTGMRARLFAQARELQQLHSTLAESVVRTQDVALTLQRAMLSTPDLEAHPDIAVRYRPALEGMNACGDWYDVVDLPEGRLALTIGDVVGHGVEAASVMGMLRAALNAAFRVADGPSGALETLGLYSRAQERALATTTFACQLFPRSRVLTYSNAGHPPPVLMHADGTHELLDQATDPPLGVRMEHVPRPQATVEYREGDLLLLYTDGLIERRFEDIDVGITRLTAALRTLRHHPPEHLADHLLEAMAAPTGQQDDISLLAIAL